MTEPLTWAAVLDDWAGFLDRLEAALDADEWSEDAMPAAWSPPGDLTAPPTADEQGRLLALTERARVLRERVEAVLRETASGIGDERRRSAGTTAYERQQRRR